MSLAAGSGVNPHGGQGGSATLRGGDGYGSPALGGYVGDGGNVDITGGDSMAGAGGLVSLRAGESAVGVGGALELMSGPGGTNGGVLTFMTCLLYTSPSPRDKRQSRMPSSA